MLNLEVNLEAYDASTTIYLGKIDRKGQGTYKILQKGAGGPTPPKTICREHYYNN